MTQQHFHTIPTSCAILPPLTQIWFVFVSCVPSTTSIQGWRSRSSRHSDLWTNVLTEIALPTLYLQPRSLHITCTDPYPHGPDVKKPENKQILSTVATVSQPPYLHKQPERKLGWLSYIHEESLQLYFKKIRPVQWSYSYVQLCSMLNLQQ